MKVSTHNEYGELRSVLIGSTDHFSWPIGDNEFDKNIVKSSGFDEELTKKPLADVVIKEATEDLSRLTDTMESAGIKVVTPQIYKPTWAYSARDILFTVGNLVIECPTPFTSRCRELDLYPDLKKADCEIIRAPRPKTENDPMFDAANLLKINDKIVYSLSHSANEAGAEWLQEQVGTEFEVVKWQVVKHQITHIDSTLLSCNKNTVIANASRLTAGTLPDFMKDFKIIWVEDCVPRDFHLFPLASKWIGMNVLSINPETIIVDELQKDLIKKLIAAKFDVIKLPMRQSRTLGGGFHCVTCDLERSQQ